MFNIQKINKDVTYVGASDRRLELFENMYPLKNGVSYNSFLIKDEKTVLIDTVDNAVAKTFFENIDIALKDRQLDYVIINHMEPDHSATLKELLIKYPDVKIISNLKVKTMINQFFDIDVDSRFQPVKEGDTLKTGNHSFNFFMAPMVHWPEVMVTYDSLDKILYSADAFGTFGALSGNIFDDEANSDNTDITEYRRYYTNIVGKYGPQVQSLLKKASLLDINIICPLHGPVIRDNISLLIEKYSKWSTYQPEDKTVMVAYASIYGGTENAVNILSNELSNLEIKKIVMYDVSKTDLSYLLAESFRCSHIVFASPTYNNRIFTKMETFMLDLVSHNLKNKSVSFIENGSWAPVSGKLMREITDKLKEITIIGETVTIKSSVKSEQYDQLICLANDIAKSL